MQEKNIPAEELKRMENNVPSFYQADDSSYLKMRLTQAYMAAAKGEYLRSMQQPGKILRLTEEAQERITYLAQQERQALIDIDALPVGSYIRTAHWELIKELGHRKNELQDLLKKVPAEDRPAPTEQALPEEVDKDWESRKIDRLAEVIGMSEDHIRELMAELAEVKETLRIATQNETSYRVWLEKSREQLASARTLILNIKTGNIYQEPADECDKWLNGNPETK